MSATAESRKLKPSQCAVCNREVKRDGYIVADDHEAFQKLRAETKRQQERGLDVPFDFTNEAGWGSVPWLAFHDSCRHCENGYHIEIDSLQTEFDLISWMQHLNGKTWIPFTNWHEFVTKASGAA